MNRLLRAATVGAIALALAGVSTALADRAYHSERLPLTLTEEGAEAGHPELQSGQVVNIHPNGPVVAAIEKYMVNGAASNTDYEVVLSVATGGCNGVGDFELSTAVLSTNARGSAHGDVVFDDLSFLQGCTVEVNWMLQAEGITAYTTETTTVALD